MAVGTESSNQLAPRDSPLKNGRGPANRMVKELGGDGAHLPLAWGDSANHPEGPLRSAWKQLRAHLRLLRTQGNEWVDPHGLVSWSGARKDSY
jgi:hypothetical protein